MKLEGTIIDINLGVTLPVVILSIMHFIRKDTSAGWKRVEAHQAEHDSESGTVSKASSLPALIVSICIAICAVMMFALIPFNPAQSTGLLSIFGSLLFLIALIIFIFYKRKSTP